MLKKAGDWIKVKPQHWVKGLDTEGFITHRNGGYVYVDLKCIDLASSKFGEMVTCEFYDCEFE